MNGKIVVSSVSLGTFSRTLCSYGFFHCHKSHLINCSQIQKYLKVGEVEMSDGTTVPVSRRRKEIFQECVIDKMDLLANH